MIATRLLVEWLYSRFRYPVCRPNRFCRHAALYFEREICGMQWLQLQHYFESARNRFTYALIWKER